ncbi:MAG: prepilin-type N-terminal cleavage/methylation domain-containing protein [Campylobacterota bacterium]|nr:prepilin-type N-terminal cleavage/methylation domain-containing protein [Campylobacterota bacterium]
MKKAFSLIELLIVILIIGIVYTLSVGNFKKMTDESKALSLGNIKEYLQTLAYEKNAELLCLDDCSICDIMVDGERINENHIEDFLDNSIRVYRYDFYNGITEQSKKVYFNSEEVEERVCFSYSVDKKGVGDQVIVEFKDKVYDFSTYLSTTPIYGSLQELSDAKENLSREVLR